MDAFQDIVGDVRDRKELGGANGKRTASGKDGGGEFPFGREGVFIEDL